MERRKWKVQDAEYLDVNESANIDYFYDVSRDSQSRFYQYK